jgi:PEP-CTERM motif
MTNRPLKAITVGLGSTAATLLMAAGQANAATCPADDPLTDLTAPGFTCTVSDKIFSDFSFSTNLATHALFSINPATGDVVVTFSRDGSLYNTGVNTFSYMVSVSSSAPAGTSIVEHTLGVDVSTATPVTMTTDTFTGNNSGSHTITLMNGGTEAVTTLPGDTSEMVMISSDQPAKAQLNSITNDFAQVLEPPPSVPEPMSLSLFGLGLAGLGLAGRKRRK